jgi:copper transport protein
MDLAFLLTAGGRTLALMGAFLLIGAAVCSWLAPARAIRRPVLGAALLLTLAVVAQTSGQLLAFDAFAADALPLAETFDMLAGTNWGRTRAMLAVLALAAFVSAALPARFTNAAARALSVLLLALIPWLGHAAAADNQLLAFSLTLLHATAAAVWLGTLALLARPWWSDVQALHHVVPRYGAVALISAPVVVASGVVTVWTRLDSPWQLLEPGYGRMVLIKTGLVALVLALGARHHLQLVRSAQGNVLAMRRSLQLEVLLTLLVLALTGWLGESEPPTLS